MVEIFLFALVAFIIFNVVMLFLEDHHLAGYFVGFLVGAFMIIPFAYFMA